MDGFIPDELAAFGVHFQRPERWKFRREPGDNDTFVFWDDDGGTLSITPRRVTGPTFAVEPFLDGVERERAGASTHFNEHRYVCFTEDDAEGSRLHWYITGRTQLILLCSFTYSSELLEDPRTAARIAEAIGHVEMIFGSLRFE